jgi:[acyl-carrier-protein] S-malonyltransferase
MAAILSLSPEQVTEICTDATRETGLTVSAANFNSPGQTVISGALAAVEKASELAKAKGARRAIMLPVSAPFHCALMQPAQEEVARVLGELTLADPRFPVAANVIGNLVTTSNEVRDCLIRQVTGAVRWVDCMKSMIGAGTQVFIELAPGTVLCGLLKQIDPEQKALNVENAASLEKTLTEVMAA